MILDLHPAAEAQITFGDLVGTLLALGVFATGAVVGGDL